MEAVVQPVFPYALQNEFRIRDNHSAQHMYQIIEFIGCIRNGRIGLRRKAFHIALYILLNHAAEDGQLFIKGNGFILNDLTFPFQALGNVLLHGCNINILLGFEVVIEHSRRAIYYIQNIPNRNRFIPFFSE